MSPNNNIMVAWKKNHVSVMSCFSVAAFEQGDRGDSYFINKPDNFSAFSASENPAEPEGGTGSSAAAPITSRTGLSVTRAGLVGHPVSIFCALVSEKMHPDNRGVSISSQGKQSRLLTRKPNVIRKGFNSHG